MIRKARYSRIKKLYKNNAHHLKNDIGSHRKHTRAKSDIPAIPELIKKEHKHGYGLSLGGEILAKLIEKKGNTPLESMRASSLKKQPDIFKSSLFSSIQYKNYQILAKGGAPALDLRKSMAKTHRRGWVYTGHLETSIIPNIESITTREESFNHKKSKLHMQKQLKLINSHRPKLEEQIIGGITSRSNLPARSLKVLYLLISEYISSKKVH